MRLVLFFCALALATHAKAQTPTDFTVKHDPVADFQLKLKPRVYFGEPERFEPVGSNQGNRGVGLSASRLFDEGRTQVTVKLFGELNGTPTTSPYRAVLSPKKERLISFGVRHTFE